MAEERDRPAEDNSGQEMATVSRVNESSRKSESSGTSHTGSSSGHKNSDSGGKKDNLIDDTQADEGARMSGEGSNDDKNDDKDKKQDGKDGEDGGQSSLKDNLKKAAVAGQASMAAAKVGMMAKALMMMKMLLQMLMMIVQAAVAAVSSIVSAVVTAIVTIVGAVGAAVATAAFGVVGLVIVAAVVAAVAVSNNNMNEAATKDATVECGEDMKMIEVDEMEGNKEQNAMYIYAFLHELGYLDNQIAGILSNYDAECGIRATALECDFLYWPNDAYVMTPEKITWAMDIPKYTSQRVIPKYSTSVIGVGAPGYRGTDGKFYCGIGIGSWTGDACRLFLEYAEQWESEGYYWWDIEVQVLYLVTDFGGDTLMNWTVSESTSPYECADWYYSHLEMPGHHVWESLGGLDMNAHADLADSWYATIQSWQTDPDAQAQISTYTAEAESLIAMANVMSARGANAASAKNQKDCNAVKFADNSDAARAAVAYSWGPGQEYHNDGTACYRTVHDGIIPGDTIYRSCDRSTTLAIRWSGTDSEIPYTWCPSIYDYLRTSPRWQQVKAEGAAWNPSQMEPGDVLINDGHVMMWVGEDIVMEKWGADGAGYNMVQGSYSTTNEAYSQSPHVFMAGSYSDYAVFRNIEKYNDHPEWTQIKCTS